MTNLLALFKSPNCKVHEAVVNYSFGAMQLRPSDWLDVFTAEMVLLAVWRMLPYATKLRHRQTWWHNIHADEVALFHPSSRNGK